MLLGNWVRGDVAGSKMACVKIPCRCAQRRHHAEARDAGAQPCSLPVGEEERLVGLNRSAERHAVLIAAEFGLRTRLRKQVARVQIFIAEELEAACRETRLLPDFPITITVPPLDRPYSGE